MADTRYYTNSLILLWPDDGGDVQEVPVYDDEVWSSNLLAFLKIWYHLRVLFYWCLSISSDTQPHAAMMQIMHELCGDFSYYFFTNDWLIVLQQYSRDGTAQGGVLVAACAVLLWHRCHAKLKGAAGVYLLHIGSSYLGPLKKHQEGSTQNMKIVLTGIGFCHIETSILNFILRDFKNFRPFLCGSTHSLNSVPY